MIDEAIRQANSNEYDYIGGEWYGKALPWMW
jgi:hypothetical protein